MYDLQMYKVCLFILKFKYEKASWQQGTCVTPCFVKNLVAVSQFRLSSKMTLLKAVNIIDLTLHFT